MTPRGRTPSFEHAREAGGRAFDVDGSDHTTRSRFTLASAPHLEEELLDLVATSVRAAELAGG